MAAPRPAPTILRVPADGLEIYAVPGFLTAHECDGLIERIDAVRRPSTIADDLGEEAFRTSETGDLSSADPLVAAIEQRIAAVLGRPLDHAEPLQGQRYAPGQEFKPHTDYFEPSLPDHAIHCARSGNREWTAMAYLNAVEEGGATHFPAIERTFEPRPGLLLVWRNLTAEGQPNYQSLHHGTKVIKGTKYVLTLWFRESPYRR